jgi:hypothetical protein
MPFAGDRVEISGIYRSAHDNHREHQSQHVLLAGHSFPRCTQCKNVEYVLVKAAPSVAEIPEFRPSSKGKPADCN